MINFISSLIPTIEWGDLNYFGQEKQLKQVINKDSASRWELTARKYCEQHYIDVSLFGSIRKKRAYVVTQDIIDNKNVTVTDSQNEANQIIRTFIKGWIISDEFFQFLQKVFHYLKVVKVVDKKDNRTFYCFQKVLESEVPFSGVVDIKIGENTMSVNTHTPVWELSTDDFRYTNVMLVMKEVSDGYFSFRSHSIVNTDSQGNKTEQRYKIGQDLTIMMRGEQILNVDSKETEYNITKEESNWIVTDPKGRKTEIDKFKPIEIVNNKDGTTIYKLYGAYTHLLRKVLGFSPQSWQMKFLLAQKRLNTIAGVRRWWKTLLSSYLIMRELYRNPSARNQSRQIKALYIAPKEEQYKSVLDYIDTASERIRILKVFKWSKDEKRLKLVDEHLGRGNKSMLVTVATCDFASGKGYEPARGNGSDFIIIDEAGFIREDVYFNILPIVENENAKLFAISTIDWSTPKNWFYELLCHYEQEGDPEGYAQRVTIDDIDENILSAPSKERMKVALKGNLQRYFAELYATFPQIHSVFATQSLFCLPMGEIIPEEVIIGYDPAKRSDYGGVVVGYIYKKQLFIVEEYAIQGDYSIYQKDFIFNLKQKYIDKKWKVSVIIDGTMVGDVVAESFGAIVDYKLWYTSWTGTSSHPEIDKWGSWKFAKKNLVHMNQSLIDLKMLQAYNTLSGLLEELKHFKAFETASGNVKYEAVTGHDDIINAMMLCGFYFWFIAGHFHTISKENSQDIRELRRNMDPQTNLIYSFAWQRVPKNDNMLKTSYTF